MRRIIQILVLLNLMLCANHINANELVLGAEYRRGDSVNICHEFWIKDRIVKVTSSEGSGKTTIGRALLRLIEPTGGVVKFEGQDITAFGPQELKKIRKDMQIIFQDPYSSLNPRMTVGGMITEILKYHEISEGAEAEKRVMYLLEKVGLSHACMPAATRMSFPAARGRGSVLRARFRLNRNL